MRAAFFIFLASIQLASAQDIVFNLSKIEHIPAKIILENSSELVGTIKDFTVPKAVEFRNVDYEFTAVEEKLDLDRSTFKFRANPGDAEQVLKLRDIKAVHLYEGKDTVVYEKLALKTVNTKNEVIDLNRTVLVPLIKKGALNIYGLKAYECGSLCNMLFAIIYIKNPNADFAYIPIDYNRVNLLNIGSIGSKFVKVLEEIGSDCPAFLQYINENKNTLSDDKTEYKKFKEHRAATLKTIKGAENKRIAGDDLDMEYQIKMYEKVVAEYAKRCK